METPAASSPQPSERTALSELALLFVRLGTTAFGGPAAHTALMQEEVVTRRKWLSNTEFLDMVAATNFIPGPNSTELAIHIGHRRRGIPGLLVAGACFILPAAILCSAIAALYLRFGQFPISQSILYGVKPVVIAIVGQALYKLAGSAVKNVPLAFLGILSVAALLLGLQELLVLFGAGVLAGLLESRPRRSTLTLLAFPALAQLAPASAPASMAVVAPAPLTALFLVFLKIGSVLFGSGYVLLAFLKADIVGRHWLTDQQLLDAIAVGQVTPGPVFTTATFIGYLVAGPAGALLATLGIFLPAFFFVAITAPILPAMRRSKPLAAFLDGLNVASLALMAVVTAQLARAALVDPLTVLLAAIALVVLLTMRLNSMWLVLAGAAMGALHAL